MGSRIYLDNAATTGVKPQVLEAMLPWFSQEYGNASSVHGFGRTAQQAVDKARAQVAKAINARTEDIYFTSGGSEADNWALRGYLEANPKRGNHIITTNVEHHAVLHTCQYLERKGYEVTYLPVDENGLITAQQVKDAIKDNTAIVSIMFANNEIGTIMPIAEIGAVCREAGVVFHTDAVQAVGNIPVDVEAMNIDMLSMSAHKFYGPKGVGALYARKGVRLTNLIYGGAQEKGKRATTYNHPGIVGMGAAIELACADLEAHMTKVSALRDKVMDGLLAAIPEARVNGDRQHRLPGNLNMSFRYIEGESLLLMLDICGIAASSGSACTSGSLDPSHVLLAIGLPHEIAHGSLRLSFGDDNTQEDADKVLEVLPGIVKRLRAMSPLTDKELL